MSEVTDQCPVCQRWLRPEGQHNHFRMHERRGEMRQRAVEGGFGPAIQWEVVESMCGIVSASELLAMQERVEAAEAKAAKIAAAAREVLDSREPLDLLDDAVDIVLLDQLESTLAAGK